MVHRGETFGFDQACDSPAELLQSDKLEQLLTIYNRTMRRQYPGVWRDVPLTQAVFRRDVIQEIYDLWKGHTGLKVDGNAPEVRRTDELADTTYKKLMKTISLRDKSDLAVASLRQLEQQLGFAA